MTANGAQIRAHPHPRCLLCGAEGLVLYRELEDRLFGAPGRWRMRRCPNPNCGILWLDPMPLPEDIGQAYQAYYTHAETKRDRNPHLQKLFNQVRSGYLAQRYGYPPEGRKMVQRLLGLLVRLHPARKASLDFDVMHLPYRPAGKLLEVGSGSGKFLESMRRLGWHVEGVDFDPHAVKCAREKGLPVVLGTLESQRYPDGSFDAVVMSHVIEHVHDPEGLLRECRRILRSRGQITVVTPNAKSLGHRVFGADWRGLEPPRHLQVFTPLALRTLAEKAGFNRLRVSVTIRSAREICRASRSIRRGQLSPRCRILESVTAAAFHFAELGTSLVQPDAGEEIVLIAWK